MFKKILVANRGEIACRVMRTARRLGIETVAVYSEADRGALHAQCADEAVCIGPPPAADSYLNIAAIVAAARETGAEAVHPGYGFLAENAAFARRLKREHIVFLGPGPRAIAVMGDKIRAKEVAAKAGVNTIPGHGQALRDARHAASAARRIGYPVMLKAAAGGGGKGMRLARSDADVRQGFASARREAKGSFGDDRLFVEKFIERPRHIEIQVLADSHGNVVHLGERECSIQRRHQKVVEEAPSPLLDGAMRRAMGEQAVALAKAVGYVSAGTVEFIVDAGRNFHFLEMNTRLQVEHPVTELVTGLDLVEQMIRIGAGEELGFSQEDVRLEGWAIEVRVYAEDPARNFLPSAGRLVRYVPPTADDTVRLDSGVYEGGDVPVHYDSMIAKLITSGADRKQAIERMRGALDAFHIRGVSHNLGFLAALVAHPRFRDGRLSTGFIDEEYGDGFDAADPAARGSRGRQAHFQVPGGHPPVAPGEARLLAAVGACVHRVCEERAAGISGQLPGHERRLAEEWVVALAGKRFRVAVVPGAEGFGVTIDGRRHSLALDWRPGAPIARLRMDGAEACVQVARNGIGYRLAHAGAQCDVLVLAERAAELHALMPVKAAPDTSKFLLSPMPGLLVSVSVAVGQEVKLGEELAVVEAMKMENVLSAGRGGVVAAIRAAPGDSLAVDQVIVEFE